ncbi:MAG: methylmalonyl-CoA epimerase [Chloroflexi bacterium]|nr:methylmalonyl-CoA epimerase [Chloroflexota bacterium]MDL1885786.1 methylmalonyl-CoA epimerase [Anaerolineae bacterium CFX8]
MSPIKVDHIAVVVEDMDTALKFWQDALGLPLGGTERNEHEAVEVAFLPVGESRIELLKPISDDSGIAKYLAKRGAGMHHLCIAVADIEAAMAKIAGQGFELINDTPRTREDGTRYAFVHPKSTGGVMIELYEVPGEKA